MTAGSSARPTSIDRTVSQQWARARAPLVLGALLLGVALLALWVTARGPEGSLDPDAVDGAGSRALARLLGARGVPVARVTSTAAVMSQARALATGGRGGTVLLVHTERLPPPELARLKDLSGLDVVLVDPPGPLLAGLAPEVRAGRRAPVAVREPGCSLPLARRAGDAHLGGSTYSVAAAGRESCYPTGQDASALVVLSRARGSLAVLGTGAPLTNRRLDERGNAALSLGLLGDRARVVWLVPPVTPPLAGPGDTTPLSRLLPPAVPRAAAQLAVAVIVLAIWRARRLGPVVSEPLPVVVRSAETVEGRARLYQAARARDRAAAALRAGARSRLAVALGLPSDAAINALVTSAASHARRSPDEVRALLDGPSPSHDAALVRLADDLDALVSEVRGS